MRKYLTRKAEIESSFKARADELGAQLLAARDEARSYNEKTRREKIKAATDAYETAMGSIRDRAISKERAMFAEASEELAAVLAKAPTAAQASYLQALSLLSSPTADDIAKASQVAAGNAIAERIVTDMGGKSGHPTSSLPIPIDLTDTLNGLEKFKKQREQSIMRYGKPETLGAVDNWNDLAFTPDGSCNAFDALDDAVGRYA